MATRHRFNSRPSREPSSNTKEGSPQTGCPLLRLPSAGPWVERAHVCVPAWRHTGRARPKPRYSSRPAVTFKRHRSRHTAAGIDDHGVLERRGRRAARTCCDGDCPPVVVPADDDTASDGSTSADLIDRETGVVGLARARISHPLARRTGEDGLAVSPTLKYFYPPLSAPRTHQASLCLTVDLSAERRGPSFPGLRRRYSHQSRTNRPNRVRDLSSLCLSRRSGGARSDRWCGSPLGRV